MTGKHIGDQTYKVHLDGYDQTHLITGKKTSARQEFFILQKAPCAQFVLMILNIGLLISPVAGWEALLKQTCRFL